MLQSMVLQRVGHDLATEKKTLIRNQPFQSLLATLLALQERRTDTMGRVGVCLHYARSVCSGLNREREATVENAVERRE